MFPFMFVIRKLPIAGTGELTAISKNVFAMFIVCVTEQVTKHLKKSNAACFYTPIVLKLLIVVQM